MLQGALHFYKTYIKSFWLSFACIAICITQRVVVHANLNNLTEEALAFIWFMAAVATFSIIFLMITIVMAFIILLVQTAQRKWEQVKQYTTIIVMKLIALTICFIFYIPPT